MSADLCRPPRTLRLENLESRLNLSTLSSLIPLAPATASASLVQDVSTDAARRYRVDSYTETQASAAASNYGVSWTNLKFADAQRFFDRFRNQFLPYVPPTPAPTPTPTPTPTPDPTPGPAPVGNPVTISQQTMGNLTRLVITGTSDNDSILVSQSGGTITIVGNGITNQVTGSFGEIAIYGGAGNDTITVNSSVNITSLLYGGTGNDTLTAAGSAQSYIVTIGSNGAGTLTGNGINTAFWANPTDTVNASSREIAGGDVHRVASFYGGVSTTLAGQNLADPSDSGLTANYSNHSLFGTGPAVTDVNQGQVGDCYFLASIQSFAADLPARLQEMAVDLGDGTYAVQFQRGGVNTFVRVDGDLPVSSWGGLLYNSPSSGGPIWASVMEKAYAFFRTGAGTYASLNSGWTGAVYSDLGVANTTFNVYGSGSALYNTIATALAGSKAVSIITNTSIAPGVSLIGSHAYSILGAFTGPGGGMWFTLRNPWGIDGIGNDGNPSDGLVTISLAQLQANCIAGSISV